MTNWNNKEEVAAYNKAWRIANREKLRAYEKVRSALPKNVEARRAYQKSRPPAVVEWQKAWAKANPERVKIKTDLNNAVKLGRIVKPKVCSLCGNGGRIEGHHPDYSKPLEVEWLCKACHVKQHQQDNI